MRPGWKFAVWAAFVAVAVLMVILIWMRAAVNEKFVGTDAPDWDTLCMRLNEAGGPEAFAQAFRETGNPTCVRPNSAQAGYDYNNCRLTSMMMSSVIGEVLLQNTDLKFLHSMLNI